MYGVIFKIINKLKFNFKTCNHNYKCKLKNLKNFYKQFFINKLK